MKPPPPEAFAGAIEELAAIPYFPSETGARIAISKQLARFVDDVGRLRWLIDTALAHMKAWPGVGELRALYGTRWRPADGVDGGDCSVRGYRPEDNEGERAKLPVAVAYLPTPEDTPITDEERAAIAALNARVKARARRGYTPPARLENL